MCEAICEHVENVEPGRVFCVEDGGIWFSGMNAHLGKLVESVAAELREAGFTVGTPREDDAVQFGGLYLPVEEAEAVDDEIHSVLVSSPGGDRETPLPDP